MKRSREPSHAYPLNTIYFYLTKGCNLRCRHCWIRPEYQGEGKTHPSLDPALFRRVLDQARPLGLASVKLTGGEPLIHPCIEDLLNEVLAGSLGLSVETNGTACTFDLARRMKACRHAHVAVSLDGTDRETHEWVRGVSGCFQETLAGIGRLVSVGFRPQIIMSVMRRNWDRLEEMVRLAESLGAGSVKFNVVQPTARGEELHRSAETLSIEELTTLGDFVEKELSASTKLSLHFGHTLAFQPLGRMFGPTGNGCSVCGIKGILGVLADGSYALCGIGESVPEMVFGRAAEEDLIDVWRNNPILQEIRSGLPHRLTGVCRECLMKARCLGTCIAQTYYATKSLWAPFWYCEQARAAGLFPASRSTGDSDRPYPPIR
ncbi:MAG: SynChlorMet cassette radical SAM/SPASM protein ScmF [Pseudomonadota bacterium]